MKACRVLALSVLLTGWLTGVAWSQMQLPQGLRGMIPDYPKASIVFAKDWDNSSQAIMETDDDPRAVMVFYRKSMIYRGWSILTGMELRTGASIVFSKGDMRLQVMSKASKEKNTTILVSIHK